MLTYTGFSVVPSGREYSFSLSARDTAARCFTVVITHAAFQQGLLKYQEGPGICYGKLLTALANEPTDCPLSTRQYVTEAEAVEYHALGRTKVRTWTEEQRLEAKRRFKAARDAGR